jgi:Rab-like protein 2
MHPSYYYRAHCCILVFDVTRKITYTHLADWYKELREFCEGIPCVLVANKIDVDYNVTRKEFKFASKHNLPFFFVSAADGTNVTKVRAVVSCCQVSERVFSCIGFSKCSARSVQI